MATTESVRIVTKKPIERVAVRAYLTSSQTDLTDTTWVKIILDAVTYDLGGNFNTTTGIFTVPVTGLYHIMGSVHFTAASAVANKSYGAAIYKNGVILRSSFEHNGSAVTEINSDILDEVYLYEGDTIELYADAIAGVSTVDVANGINSTLLLVRLITKEGIRI